MTRTEHLLWILAEECAEVAQRASKAARFGMDEIQPEQTLSNLQRVVYEMNDLVAVADMVLNPDWMDADAINAKQQKVEKYLRYSEECGTLEQEIRKGKQENYTVIFHGCYWKDRRVE